MESIYGDLDYLVMQKQQLIEELVDQLVEDTIREERELDYYVLFYRIWS